MRVLVTHGFELVVFVLNHVFKFLDMGESVAHHLLPFPSFGSDAHRRQVLLDGLFYQKVRLSPLDLCLYLYRLP